MRLFSALTFRPHRLTFPHFRVYAVLKSSRQTARIGKAGKGFPIIQWQADIPQ